MVDQPQIKSKVIGISAVMNNPNLAKTIQDALSSSPGSSKRENAIAVLKSINRYGQDYSGQGGSPYDSLMSPTQGAGIPPSQRLEGMPASTSPALQGTSPQLQGTSPQLQAGQIDLEQPEPLPTIVFPAAPKAKETLTSPVPLEDTTVTGEEISPDFYDNWYQGLDEAGRERWKPLYEAITAGVGPKTFAWQIMTDTEELKKLLPGVPTDALPSGASLTRQVADLKDSLKEEYKIDELADNLTQLKQQGVTIEDDLTNYITSRDKYIEKLDSMIDQAKESVLTLDMANPYVAKKMENYMNYLHIMRGRQQQRYADFLDTAVKQYSSEFQMAQDAYNKAYDDFADAFTTEVDITEEDYNRLNVMLQEMYNNVSQMEKRTYDMGILRENWLQEQSKTVEDSLSVVGEIPMTDTQEGSAWGKYKAANPEKDIDDWTMLSNSEKWLWYKGQAAASEEDINFFLLMISQKNPDYYDRDTKTIKWKSVPDKYRTAVMAAIRKAKEQKAATAKPGYSIWDFLPKPSNLGIPGLDILIKALK